MEFIPCEYYFFLNDGRGGSGGRDHTRWCYLVIIAELGLGPQVGVMVHVTCDQRQKATKHFYYLLDPHQDFGFSLIIFISLVGVGGFKILNLKKSES